MRHGQKGPVITSRQRLSIEPNLSRNFNAQRCRQRQKFLPGRNVEWHSIFMDIVSEAGFTPESLKAALIKTMLEKRMLENMARNLVLGEHDFQDKEH